MTNPLYEIPTGLPKTGSLKTVCRLASRDSRSHSLCQFSVAARRPISSAVHSLDCEVT